MKEFVYSHARAQAEHFKALGITEVWIKQDLWSNLIYPWNLVVDVAERGVKNSIRITAHDPEVELKFWWFYNLEEEQNTNGPHGINTASCRAIMKSMSAEGREKFRKVLLSIAEKARERANEFSKDAEKLMLDAATLSDIACMS